MVLGRWPPTPRSRPSRWATTRRCPRWPAGPARSHHYLQQRFAQVTNPPIDPLRERLVMSPAHAARAPRPPPQRARADATRLLAPRVVLPLPRRPSTQLADGQTPFPAVDARRHVPRGRRARRPAGRRSPGWPTRPRRSPPTGPGSSSSTDAGADADRAPVPSLLAVGAVHHRLIELGGARDVEPGRRGRRRPRRALLRRPARLRRRRHLPPPGAGDRRRRADDSDDDDLVGPEAQDRFQAAVEAGVLKILSKMGISTVDSYRGAQIFEVVGLGRRGRRPLLHRARRRSVGGIGWAHLGEDALARHAAPGASGRPGVARLLPGPQGRRVPRPQQGRRPGPQRPDPGARSRPTDGPGSDMTAAHLLQRAINGESYDLYEPFARAGRRPAADRAARPARAGRRPTEPVPLDEVEPASEHRPALLDRGHVPRGAVQGGPRDAGPGHEPARRPVQLRRGRRGPRPLPHPGPRPRRQELAASSRSPRAASASRPSTWPTPTSSRSRWPRAPSPARAASSPATRCRDEIARLRHTQPGVGLISPPPHHDIYSIEDLAQLIYDLKQVNAAQVSVKLVAEDGVGTIAAGVRQGAGRRRADLAAPTAAPGPARSRRSSTPACPGSSAWPTPSGRWSTTACAAGSGSGSTAASRPAAR